MDGFHKDFPFGKGIFIWYINQCDNGDISKIIQRLKTHNFSYVVFKSGDGRNQWGQLTRDIINAFHQVNIKVYSWSYIYGIDPNAEADVAINSLNLGVDGHIFDAEVEYQNLGNSGIVANTMFTKVRGVHPQSFLGYSTFPLIDLHTPFPYHIFGHFCNAAFPQMYWGTIYKSTVFNRPMAMVMDTYASWSKWETTWKREGFTDSVKPIVPVGQGYDNPATGYTLNPLDIKTFIDGVSGYMSVCFWSYQHLLRNDCWQAIADTPLKQPVVKATETPAVVAPEPPKIVEPVPTPPTPPVVIEAVVPLPIPNPLPTVITPDKSTPDQGPLPAQVVLPSSGVATVKVNPDSTVSVFYGKKHIDILLDLLKWIKSLIVK